MTDRMLQVNELIRAEFAALLPREVELPNDSLVTVTRVETSRDLQSATVYLSILPQDNEQEIFAFLEKELPALQRKIAAKLSMKFTPVLRLQIDEIEKKATRIDQILDGIAEEL